MANSPNLGIAYLEASQSQKHVTANEAFLALDAIVQLAVLDRDLTTPPASPSDGSRYIVPVGATSVWADHTGKIAAFQDGAWALLIPREGWLAWVVDEDVLLVWSGAAWVPVSASLNPTPLIGVNATADTTNRLAVAAPATLLNHDGAGHQLKINKAAATDTASLLYQSGFSGRAEIGLTGNDNLSVKVSADGVTWREAMTIDPASGNLAFGGTPPTGAGATRAYFELVGTNTAVFVNTSPPAAGAGAGMIGYTNDTPTAVDQRLGFLVFGSRLGIASTANQVAINGFSEEAWTATSRGAYFSFQTTAPGGTGRAERMRITGSGNVGIGTTAPTVRLDVAGAVKVLGYTVATLPSASSSGAGAIVYASNATGGAVLVFSDGTSWRRVTDRIVVT